MNLDQAKELLSMCKRIELRDHAFGDSEFSWVKNDIIVATGYFSGREFSVLIDFVGGSESFTGDEARALRECGTDVEIDRNDETGPSEYQEGVTMPGLTLEGVREEIEGAKGRHPSG